MPTIAGLLAGAALATAAFLLQPTFASAALAQDWPSFALVAGLLLVGLLAQEDGVFAAAGQWLGGCARADLVVFCWASVLIAVVTALLNLDTSVAFLTPVLLYTARARGTPEAPLLYGCLLLSNAGSLLLPGSNLTNLIVLGHLQLTGRDFLQHMTAPFLAAVAVTALGVVAVHRRSFGARTEMAAAKAPFRWGLGAAVLVAAVVLIVGTSQPALPVLVVGGVGVLIRLFTGRETVGRVLSVLGPPTLVALLGLAVLCGTLGRLWAAPSRLLSTLGPWLTAYLSAGVSVLCNNLPAASLLAARVPQHPFALLIGLNVGPNLFCTGSLAWVLWYRTAKGAGTTPSMWHASALGLLTAPMAIAAAVALVQ